MPKIKRKKYKKPPPLTVAQRRRLSKVYNYKRISPAEHKAQKFFGPILVPRAPYRAPQAIDFLKFGGQMLRSNHEEAIKKAKRKASQKAYRESDHGKRVIQAYRNSPEGKESARKARAKYKTTSKYKEARKKANAKARAKRKARKNIIIIE